MKNFDFAAIICLPAVLGYISLNSSVELPMIKLVLALMLLLSTSFLAAARVTKSSTQTASAVGGGVEHPWKSPYKIA